MILSSNYSCQRSFILLGDMTTATALVPHGHCSARREALPNLREWSWDRAIYLLTWAEHDAGRSWPHVRTSGNRSRGPDACGSRSDTRDVIPVSRTCSHTRGVGAEDLWNPFKGKTWRIHRAYL